MAARRGWSSDHPSSNEAPQALQSRGTQLPAALCEARRHFADGRTSETSRRQSLFPPSRSEEQPRKSRGVWRVDGKAEVRRWVVRFETLWPSLGQISIIQQPATRLSNFTLPPLDHQHLVLLRLHARHQTSFIALATTKRITIRQNGWPSVALSSDLYPMRYVTMLWTRRPAIH